MEEIKLNENDNSNKILNNQIKENDKLNENDNSNENSNNNSNEISNSSISNNDLNIYNTYNDNREINHNIQFNQNCFNVIFQSNPMNVPYNMYNNNNINIIDPNSYSPMIYGMDNQKLYYSNNLNRYIYNINQIEKNKILPYAYISRNGVDKPNFNIIQNKLKLYNYWIETNDPRYIENEIINMFGIQNIYITKSLFFRKKDSYMGEKVILVNKIPQKPYKFVNRINRTFSKERRTIKSTLGDYIISPDCLFIVLADKSIEYICNNYFRYHKMEEMKIETLINSFKSKFTCIKDKDIL